MAKVAFVSPLPPAQTGIATYAAAVLAGFDEIHVEERHEVERLWPLPEDAERRVAEADVAVYQLGNNEEFHGEIYALSVFHPGVVVLHDLALDGLFYGLGLANDPLVEPARAEAIASTPRGMSADDPLGIPWCAQAVRRSRAVIVHSKFARDYLGSIGCRTPVYVATHPLVEADEEIDRARERRDELRAQARVGPEELLVGVAGDLNGMKGIAELMEAASRMRTRIRIALVGRLSPHWDLQAAIGRSGVGDRVTVIPNAPDDDFLAWLCAFDVLINLRHPHRGETSGSLVRALHAGVPTIVSATGTYLEVPDDVVARIPGGPPEPAALAGAIDRLAEDAEERRALGERAQAWARVALDPGVTARTYETAIDDVVALEADPARVALARWAATLRSVGVGPTHVKRGYGLRYAEAITELRDVGPGASAILG